MKIGDLAQRTGTPVETIRYYERQGLLPAPPRTGSNYRLYGEAHAERLAFVRRGRALGMNLDEIRQLLQLKDQPQADCAEVNTLLDAHIGHVARRIAELQALEAQLLALRQACAAAHGDVAHCGILERLSHGAPGAAESPCPPPGGPAADGLHRGGPD
ncbi:Cd(II)/Pb(II)-responsive transcriptional regulator [Ideonella livida]|uniref:Cd(II)/Pb(II)-responsive transcriptional regulator n=1 Tax=Ideonella livida TaxID=2707176 RepID=A0A7C9PHE3_9BURK|nr:Cd(II)/Pb(II)-responsive transcriptional regulator [Ideonella livida]NDY92055.1 Cd(II)/Pb(II)-responsive transcriptional regulator [Ideonella livida]